MGLINKDVFQNRYGQEIYNTYISLGDNSIEIRKESEMNQNDNAIYILTAVFNTWLSKESRDNGKIPFSTHMVSKTLSSDQITSNIYNILYTEVKKKYSNTTDVI